MTDMCYVLVMCASASVPALVPPVMVLICWHASSPVGECKLEVPLRKFEVHFLNIHVYIHVCLG